MLYHCVYLSGSGREFNGGIWELKETDKTICFKQVIKSFFNPNLTLIRINKFYNKKHFREDGNYSAVRECEDSGVKYVGYFNNGHCLRKWEDGTYTAYPDKCGVPHIFEPISEEGLRRYKIANWCENN